MRPLRACTPVHVCMPLSASVLNICLYWVAWSITQHRSHVQGHPKTMPPTKMLITSTYVQRFTSYLVHINFRLWRIIPQRFQFVGQMVRLLCYLQNVFQTLPICTEKILVHEWAHFRWGVFDEYALEGEPQFYYSPSSGQLEGVRCTELIRGILRRTDPVTGHPAYCRALDPNTGLYPEGCEFMPYPAGPYVAGVEASIMDQLSISPVSSLFFNKKNYFILF